jgi:hypothetical protein
MYITRLASNEIFSPSNNIKREVGRANDLSAPQIYTCLTWVGICGIKPCYDCRSYPSIDIPFVFEIEFKQKWTVTMIVYSACVVRILNNYRTLPIKLVRPPVANDWCQMREITRFSSEYSNKVLNKNKICEKKINVGYILIIYVRNRLEFYFLFVAEWNAFEWSAFLSDPRTSCRTVT